MTSVQVRHFVVDAGLDLDIAEFELQIKLESTHPLEVDLATLLEANAMAEHDIDRELRYRVLQHELRIILSYILDEGPGGHLRLDTENFAATAGHIKRFISESVGLGMLTAAVQNFFAWEFGPDAISNFDVLPGEMKHQFAKGGVRPDLLFDFKDGARVIAGEARGRSQPGPTGMITRAEQRQRMKDMLRWSSDHGNYPVTMTWAYLGGQNIKVDLFTMSDQSAGSLEYIHKAMAIHDEAEVRHQFTTEATMRGQRRATRLFETAPVAPVQEPRRLFGQEVRGDWVTADLVRPSDLRLFVGAVEEPVPAAEVREVRSRVRRGARPQASSYEAALSDRLVIVVARSEDPEPAWSNVETFIELGDGDV
jgi:hypothetical protein